MKKLFEITVLICLSSAIAHGASFDCNKASTRTEKIICSNVKLSSADEQLAKIYKEALAASTDKEALRREQREWLSSQRDVCTTAECMLDAYLARIGLLEKILGGAATASNQATEVTPLFVIKAVPKTTLTKIETDNIKARRAFEVSGTIEFGHDAAGGNYFVNDERKSNIYWAMFGKSKMRRNSNFQNSPTRTQE